MARKKALVTQHLENISREALGRYQEIIRRHIRGRQGIYALYQRGKLYYVGLATDLRNRLKAHLKDHHIKEWDRFSVYLTIGDEHMRELEALILRIVKPKGNKVQGRFTKSESLFRKLRKDLRQERLREEVELLGGVKVRNAAKKAVAKPREKSKATGRRPVLAPFITGPMNLVARFKGKTLRARVRKDGSISYGGAVFNSPSLAGQAAVQRKTCNGWTFWTYERSPGDWVLLEELRKRRG